MRTLATQFGISDVALAKTCRRSAIPVPKRGYWAKLQAGEKVMRTPLPSRGPGMPDQILIRGTDEGVGPGQLCPATDLPCHDDPDAEWHCAGGARLFRHFIAWAEPIVDAPAAHSVELRER
jgi:hypothetical protein